MAQGLFLRTAAIVLAVAAFGCSASHSTTDDDAGARSDAGAGGDASGAVDVGAAVDAFHADSGVPTSCAIMEASAMVCAPLACDGPPTYFWDGSHCFPIGCGECEGADCDRGFGSMEECDAAHRDCEASLCRTTGGDWLSALRYCGHHVCGREGLAICESPTPACNCGAARNFVPGVGCVIDESCPAPDPTISPEAICTSSGGTWENVCCPSTCGAPCGALCLAPACTCGELQIWDDVLGCVDSSTCIERGEGEVCTTSTRCDDGLICCQHCGGAGCAPDATCEWPTCDSDPMIDTCGNHLLAP